MNKWLYFMMSLGSIFIVMAPTSEAMLEFMVLGLVFLIVPAVILFVKRDK